MFEVTLGPLLGGEAPFAAGVLARGMRDNPNAVAALGADPDGRINALQRLFLPNLGKLEVLCARRGAVAVGVSAVAPPAHCAPDLAQRVRQWPAIAALGPARTLRLRQWSREWGKRDPAEPHWHLGPIAVELALQGLGIGTQMLAVCCGRMDADGGAGYLETDKEENVRFYASFGFEVVEEAPVLGMRNWFMRRPPRR